MTPGPRIEWPAQAPPDDFADKVVSAALGERQAEARAEPLVAAAEPVPVRQGAWRARLGWLVAAAFGATLVVTGLAVNNAREAERQRAAQAAIVAAKEEEARALQQQLVEAQQRIDAFMDQLATVQNDAQRSELKLKIDQEKARQTALRSRFGAGRPASGAAAACKCQQGDPLCSCL